MGAKPGETRALKEVAVERGIKVIDSPGIVWGDQGDSEGGVLRNVWSLEGLEDPPMVGTLNIPFSYCVRNLDLTNVDRFLRTKVEGIVSRVPAETLQEMYGTPPFKDAMEFLMMVALVRGKLGKVRTRSFPQFLCGAFGLPFHLLGGCSRHLLSSSVSHP